MAIAFVGSANAPNSGSATFTVGSRTYTTGNFLGIFVIWEDVTTTISSISGGGNTYSWTPPNQTADFSVRSQWAYAKNITGFTGSITVTLANTPGFGRVVVVEYSGIDTSAPLDQWNTGGATTGTAATSGSITTTQADELLLAGVGLYGSKTGTYGANWTSRYEANDTIKVADRIVSSTGTYSVSGTGADSITWSGSVNHADGIASFKAATGGGASAQPNFLTLAGAGA